MPAKKADATGIELAKIDARTKRTMIVSISIAFCVCFWKLNDTVVAIVSQPEPPWWKVALMIIVPSGMASVPTWMLIRKVRKIIRERLSVMAKREKIADPQRTTSGVLTDGTHPHD
jgi:hypothetical protein